MIKYVEYDDSGEILHMVEVYTTGSEEELRESLKNIPVHNAGLIILKSEDDLPAMDAYKVDIPTGDIVEMTNAEKTARVEARVLPQN